MDCNGLAMEWEGTPAVRGIVRSSGTFLVYPLNAKFCEPTRNNCVANEGILVPLLHKLSATDSWVLPHLDPLQLELSLLADKLGVKLGAKGVYAPAVELKKLASFVKRRVRRKEVTKAGTTQNMI